MEEGLARGLWTSDRLDAIIAEEEGRGRKCITWLMVALAAEVVVAAMFWAGFHETSVLVTLLFYDVRFFIVTGLKKAFVFAGADGAEAYTSVL